MSAAALQAALERAARDFADIQFDAPKHIARLALKGEQRCRDALAEHRKPAAPKRRKAA